MRERLGRVLLLLQPPQRAENRVLELRHVGHRAGLRAGPEPRRDEVARLGHGVGHRAARRLLVQEAKREPLLVEPVEAGLRLDLLPARARRPAEAPRLLDPLLVRQLEDAVHVLGDDGEEALEHRDRLRLRVLSPRRRDEPLQGVPSEDRAVRIGLADLRHDLLHALLPDPRRVLEEPHRQDGVAVDVVDVDDRLVVDREAEDDRLADLLAGRLGHETQAPGVVIEREATHRRVELRPLHEAVEGDVLGEEVGEREDQTLLEIDLHFLFRAVRPFRVTGAAP